MTLRITVKDTETGNRIEMELQGENTVDEAIESACSYWNKAAGAFVLRHGATLLLGRSTLAQSGVVASALLELVPDPQGG